MTILQLLLAVLVFGLALWLINRYVAPGAFRNVLVGLVIVLALIVLLADFGLMSLLNTPVAGRIR